jgi:hypothetical protein
MEKLADIDVDGRIILKWTLEHGGERVDWIHLAQDTDQCQWRAVVSTIMKFQDSYKAGRTLLRGVNLGG